MRFHRFIGALVVVGCATPFMLHGQEPSAPTAVIRTSGTGTVEIEADLAILSIGVEVQEREASAAREEMDRRIAGVLDTLVSLGFPRDSIPTTGYVVRPRYDYERDRRITGYVAVSSIQVTTHDLALVAPVIVAALEAGGTTLGALRFDASNREAARQEALRLAVTEARRDAETLARAAGGRLGELVELSTDRSRSAFAPSPTAITAMQARVTPPQINPRDVTVSATVYGCWRFEPGDP